MLVQVQIVNCTRYNIIRCVQTLSLLLYYCCTNCGPGFPLDLCLYKCKEFSVDGTISYVVFQNIVITALL